MQDLIAGNIQVLFDPVQTSIPQIQSGKVRALAVTSKTRFAELPNLPTVAESGYPGFDANTWTGVLVAARTPAPIIERLNKEIAHILDLPDMKERLNTGGNPVETGPKAFAALLKADTEKWARIVKDAGLKVE
jgi:tripartite-type tricarboxylate transporter receptor subunit TctC